MSKETYTRPGDLAQRCRQPGLCPKFDTQSRVKILRISRSRMVTMWSATKPVGSKFDSCYVVMSKECSRQSASAGVTDDTGQKMHSYASTFYIICNDPTIRFVLSTAKDNVL